MSHDEQMFVSARINLARQKRIAKGFPSAFAKERAKRLLSLLNSPSVIISSHFFSHSVLPFSSGSIWMFSRKLTIRHNRLNFGIFSPYDFTRSLFNRRRALNGQNLGKMQSSQYRPSGYFLPICAPPMD